MKLFIFPFAGGSQYSFNDYKKHFPSEPEICAFDYPGHGKRISEPLLDEITAIVDDAYNFLANQFQVEYCFWGHSMGAVVAFLLCHKLRENGKQLPLQLIVSGRNAINTPSRKEKISQYPTNLFTDKLRELGGTTEEVLSNRELMEFFEPQLRSDFKAIENFRHNPFHPLAIPIQVWVGTEEDFLPEEITDWQMSTFLPINITRFPGNHFFLFNNIEIISELIKGFLKKRVMADA